MHIVFMHATYDIQSIISDILTVADIYSLISIDMDLWNKLSGSTVLVKGSDYQRKTQCHKLIAIIF